MILKVGPDVPTVENEAGVRQAALDYRFDLVDPRAMFALAAVLKRGAEKYGVDNWRGLTTGDHLNHALVHVYAYMAGDTQDDHLSHAFCRLMMAVGTEQAGSVDRVAVDAAARVAYATAKLDAFGPVRHD